MAKQYMSKIKLALILVAVATFLQMIVDYLQSEAQGVPMPTTLKLLVFLACAISLYAAYISYKRRR